MVLKLKEMVLIAVSPKTIFSEPLLLPTKTVFEQKAKVSPLKCMLKPTPDLQGAYLCFPNPRLCFQLQLITVS